MPISTTGTNKLNGLDHLRTLAISLVFIYHYGQLFPHPTWANRIGKFGWTGVDLFFVLSGYLIASQLFEKTRNNKRLSLPEFFIKRFFRIIPAYLVILSIYFFIPYAREWEGLAPAWKYLTFTQNFGLNLLTQRTFSHVWSLCIEEQFYFTLPFILFLLVNFKAISKGFIILVVLFIACFFSRYFSYTILVEPYLDTDAGWQYWYKWIYYPTYCRLDGLLTGVSIAALFSFRPMLKERLAGYGNHLLILGIIILTGAYFICLDQGSFASSVFGFPLVSIGYGIMLMGAISRKNILFKLRSTTSLAIATLSYGLYLSHKIVIHITQDQLSKYGIKANGTLMFIICIVTCFVAAWILNIIVEKPFLKLRERILKKIRSNKKDLVTVAGK